MSVQPDISNMRGVLRMNKFLLTVWPERLCGALREEIRQLEIEIMKTKTATKAPKATAENTAPVRPPHAGWWLGVDSPVTTGGMVYPRNSEITVAACGRNIQSMLDKKPSRVSWRPPGPRTAKPYAAPGSTPAAPRKELVFIQGSGDVVEDWRATVKANTIGPDSNTAKDRLLGTDRGSRMYLQAQRIDADRRALASNQYGRRPIDATL